eukprot:2970710-Alexandrium_andersonii.AAC.1
MYVPRGPAGLPPDLVAFRGSVSEGRFALPGSHVLNFCAPASWEADRSVRRQVFMYALEEDNGRRRVVMDAGGRPALTVRWLAMCSVAAVRVA